MYPIQLATQAEITGKPAGETLKFFVNSATGALTFQKPDGTFREVFAGAVPVIITL